LLTGIGKLDFTNVLTWNKYTLWLKGVGDYTVRRKIPAISNIYKTANVLNANTINYVDNVFNEEDGDGKFCYYLEAIESQTNQYGYQDSSLSNEMCVIQVPRLFVPNVIVPDGNNNSFFPKGTYIDKTSYSMEVFNRWGEKVFTTKNWEEGWNGTHKDKIVQAGAYIFVINFKSSTGEALSKKGVVQVLW
jgi:gliding motility-associated-like protein